MVPYVVCFGLLPVFVVLGCPGTPAPPWWLPVAGGLLGAGAHFANVLPDLDDDAATGVRGLPHRLGARAPGWWPRRAAAGGDRRCSRSGRRCRRSLAAAVPVVAAVVLAAGFRAGRRPGSRAPFRAVWSSPDRRSHCWWPPVPPVGGLNRVR